ncbi:hypothetical protein ND861_05880 [Leptospira sp. 2 VSF19]|uniref:1-aminocyclopropane-1-carboxylate deaminase n=1 Tax=Leptospira soteropolitanensis TaxID=2950025 RepID=A0AAW5VC22_9LEPT|nr:hypothetical protein [Leptospira soteropolitanensis]MCW7492184.1 hypothetical protein [Leptospira soteropolitanensis]MCW7499766.1 hypothetical protein [Leptospira soteropolitanensis]MCW7522017.1 hypothetical protein [Leptospira soteropolitanensis]MCW7525871.1 hypothetical protein [Leptospira soteropolitanensis]MCW7530015.1 hypothetical protein [Leptospira soteropolitanensis]
MNLVPSDPFDHSRFFPDLPTRISEIHLVATLNPLLLTEANSSHNLVTQSMPRLHIIRDDLLPFGFGTKWRKAFGILQYLQKNQICKVLLWGAIHGNYLASFTYILRRSGITVDTITYTKDPNFHSYNERLVRGHSHTLICYANRKDALAVWLEKKKNYRGLALPEFGIHEGQNLGLRSFWQELEKKIFQSIDASKAQMDPISQRYQRTNAILRMEIGSGATFLSALNYFNETSILVQGVMVGEKKETWILKTEDLQKQLSLRSIAIKEEQILKIEKENKSQVEPEKNKATKPISFGKQTQVQKQWIYDFYRNTDILLEPIYSGMTIKPLLREIYEMQLSPSFVLETIPPPIFYLHQGGQIQHLNLILEKESK